MQVISIFYNGNNNKNQNGFQREIKIKGQSPEAVENFKYTYLGSVISNEESKSEILSKVAQTTAAHIRLNKEEQKYLLCF